MGKIARTRKFIDLMLAFATQDACGAHNCLFAALTDNDPRSKSWALLRDAMHRVEQQVEQHA